jgi:hypothetical protein
MVALAVTCAGCLDSAVPRSASVMAACLRAAITSSTVQPTTAPVATPSRVTLRGWKR